MASWWMFFWSIQRIIREQAIGQGSTDPFYLFPNWADIVCAFSRDKRASDLDVPFAVFDLWIELAWLSPRKNRISLPL